jgi:endonuclease/exonuclease/phosphatase family metal-dependent hydrolase
LIVTNTVERLPIPSASVRRAIHEGPVNGAAFEAALARLEALHALEVAEPPSPPAPPTRARIAFWNAERLKYPAATGALLRGLDADANLLCELDLGMARSGNCHTIADLSDSLGAGYVFGVEFVELDLGDARERRWHASESNEAGLHGAGILSRHRLERPALVRLETSGRWFDGGFGERRVGGRIAVMAELKLAGGPVLLVSVHYESHTDPADRVAQTRAMLDAIDAHGPGRPVLIGGDFNTSTFDLATKGQPERVAAALAEDPQRLVAPMRYEPMFEELRARGYDATACNVPLAPTQRTRPDGTPQPPFGKIDWLFARDLVCSEPTIVPAIDEAGEAISDHEVLVVTIAPLRA